MNYLFLDASGSNTYGQIGVKDEIFTKTENTNRNLGSKITKFCDSLLLKSKLEKDNIDSFVIGTGPGSLTGLRIAGSFLRACAYLSDKPVIGVSLFDWAIQTLKEEKKNKTVRFLIPTLIDKAFYLDVCIESKLVLSNLKPKFATLNTLIDCEYEVFGIKYSSPNVKEIKLSKTALHTIIKENQSSNENNFVDMLEVLPMYVIPSQAERKFQEKKC